VVDGRVFAEDEVEDFEVIWEGSEDGVVEWLAVVDARSVVEEQVY
jgi:hypothetical protein